MKLNNPMKYLITISWCSMGFIVGLLVFARGLLLHREVLPNKSSCAVHDESCRELKTMYALEKCLSSHPSPKQICSTSEFKIVLIVIDALRYDFIQYNERSSNESFYLNKLVVIRDLLKNHPSKSRLFKFIADPPTTTMQRILGLTTGSLPTFIDVGSNFASSEINEDNIVDMLNRHGKNVVFLGDDTWSKLYPNRFIRSYPFDSFNVWDLDTVDFGIREHLGKELRKHDWQLLIAHFLGVDHCGHRYGPDHPEMKRKLEEMNEVLEGIVEQIEHSNDTLLFVVGDHGMTYTGDHGGDTENEINTALFTYSPVYDLYSVSSLTEIMRQVDLAPTLSSILGLPIPFSSVGSVVLECFPVALVSTLSEVVFQLWRNVEQITNYVLEYSVHNAQLKTTKKVDATLLRYQTLKKVRTSFDSDISSFLREYRTFMTDVSAMCREVWVQFDFVSIGCGLCIILVMSTLCYCICETLTLDRVHVCLESNVFVFVGKVICLLPIVIFSVISLFGTNVEITAYVATGITCIGVIIWRFRLSCVRAEEFMLMLRQRITFFDVFVTLVVLVWLCGLFSNSFIMHEPSVIFFFMFSLLWTHFLFHRSPKKIWTQTKLLFYVAFVHISYRVAFEFLKCHEDQVHCDDIVTKKHEAWLCVISLVTLGLFIGNWLKSRPPKLTACVAVFGTLLLVVYWVCETFFENIVFSLYIPAILLPTFVLSICCSMVSPHLRSRCSSLWSSIDASFMNVAALMGLLGCVILGQTYTVPVVLMIVSIRALAVLLSSCYRSVGRDGNRHRVPWSDVILWAMSSIYGFHVTGHYASFSGIQWNAAFLVQKEIGNDMLVPSTLVMLNTFFSYIVHAVMLPILLIFRLAPSLPPILLIQPTNGATSIKVQFYTNGLESFYHGVFILTLKYLSFFGIRLFFVTLSATILSRHLMMWKIFAPKFIFEAIAFIAITVPSILVGFAYVYRIGNKIRDETLKHDN